MATINHWSIFLDMILLSCIAGCASQADFVWGENEMPSEWLVKKSNVISECVSLNGDYLNLGIGKLENNASFTETRLDVALGHTFPSINMPNFVGVSAEQGSAFISFFFGDPIGESFSVNTNCSNGWYQFELSQNSQYVGDGTNLDFADRKISLAKAVDGDLLVHLVLKAQFSSLTVIKTIEQREVWSKYKLAIKKE